MIKAFFEVYKILNKIGIKPKDVIGMGGDIVKMGKSLFNTRVNPKLLEFIAKNDKIPAKILENIKLHARTLKNASENQKNLFLENIKSISQAKTPVKIPKSLSPVSSVQKQATSDNGIAIIQKLSRKLALKNQKGRNTLPTAEAAESHAGSIGARIQDVKGWTQSQMNKFIKSENQLVKILDDWDYGAAMTKQSFKKVPEKVIDFKGWTPKVIKGGKDKLADGGRAKFEDGKGVQISPILSMSQTSETPVEGIDVDVSDTDYGIAGIYQGDNLYAGGEYIKGKVKVNVQEEGNTVFEDSMSKDDMMQLYLGLGQKEGNHVEVGTDGQGNYTLNIIKSFAKGGIANHFRVR